eukprot:scaffold2.g7410.t1
MHVFIALQAVEGLADALDNVGQLIRRLHTHGLHSAVLVHAAAGAAAAATGALHSLQQAARACQCTVLATPDTPDQRLISLRAAADRLGASAQRLIIACVSQEPALAQEAAAHGFNALHLTPSDARGPWLHAAVLQAVAAAAARQAAPPALLVGHAMKASRAAALEAEGMLPLLPTDGVCFAPLVLGRPLASQVACDLLLHKLTDSLRPNSGSGEVPALTTDAEAFLAQAAEAAARGGPPLVDAMPAVEAAMDRVALAEVLGRAATAVRRRSIPMRAPAWALVPALDAAATPAALGAAGVRLPCIAKPRAACGVAEAHQMALVLAGEGFSGLEVPVPAVVQEYIDHGGRVCKVYVAGTEVFYTQRRSTPDLGPLAAQLADDPEADIPAAIDFDSLRSLPTSLPWGRRRGPGPAAEEAAVGAGGGSPAAAPVPPVPPASAEELLLRAETVRVVAGVLHDELGLTLFGFDLVVDPAAGELVIIDLNYFPSFKGAPEAPAALRAALRGRHARWQQEARQGQLVQQAQQGLHAVAAGVAG